MMRSSRPLLARSTMAAPTATPVHVDNAHPNVPSIRLISATPSASGLSLDSTPSFPHHPRQQSSPEIAILAPKPDPNQISHRKLVPKKSKLGILSIGRDKEKDRARDLSDDGRRVGAPAYSHRPDFEGDADILVDDEFVIVKKKKSRLGLDGMSWGPLSEATNVPKVAKSNAAQPVPKENPATLKVKNDEERKWWSIGRGRKDSKEKEKEKEKEKTKGKENKISTNAIPLESTLRVTDQKTQGSSKEYRGRFNSFDSGLLLGNSAATVDANICSNAPNIRPQTPTFQFSEPEQDPIPERARSATPSAGTFFRSATPTIGGLLAPPSQKAMEDKPGSIALRAIRSMRSLARIGSWAQLKTSSHPTAQEIAEQMRKAESEGEKRKEKKEKKKKDGTVKEKKKKDGTVKEKKKKDGTVKEKKKKDGTVKEKKKVKGDSSGTLGSSLKGDKSQTIRISTSSFEVGHLSASPESPKAVTVSKKHSILGLGLPSTMRLPRMRGGSTASSVNLNGGSSVMPPPSTVGPMAPAGTSRLSVETARPASVLSSNGSSLRPASVASSNSRLSTGSSVVSGSSGTSVKWDEQGLETVREQRRKEREERRLSEDLASSGRRSSRESRRSSEGRRRTPLSSIFPEVQHHQIGVSMLNDVVEELQEVSKGSVPADHDSDAASTISANTTTSSMLMSRRSYGMHPILTIEEATSDGHEDPGEDDQDTANQLNPTATPVKRRARPMSEQLLGKSRPKAMHEDEEGVLSILSAATNDLASLINTLDLQATPSTPDMTPLKASNQLESPLKRTLRRQVSSLASLRPYAQSRGYNAKLASSNPTALVECPDLENKKPAPADLIGQQIAPWPVLIASVSPAKSSKLVDTEPSRAMSPAKPFKPGHKRTMTPAREPDPEPTFQPLKPARTKAPLQEATVRGPKSSAKLSVDVHGNGNRYLDAELFSSRTFGSRSSCGSMVIDELASPTARTGSLTPVFKRIQEFEDFKRASPCSADDLRNCDSLDDCSQLLDDSPGGLFAVPIARQVRDILGRSGTLGGSDLSAYTGNQPDPSDPDSDVPDELKVILAAHSDNASVSDAWSFREEETSQASPLTPRPPNDTLVSPTVEPPVFYLTLTDNEQNVLGVDGESAHSSEEDTKKSFDFTGEIMKLNEAGASDRASFVEQLEIAFKTPAKVDLRYDFGTHLEVEVPPLPSAPVAPRNSAETNSGHSSSLGVDYPNQSQLLDVDEPSALQIREGGSNSQDSSKFDVASASDLVHVGEPSLLQDLTSDESNLSNEGLALAHSTSSAQSDGKLDRSFKFGGRHKQPSPDHELTLSDIIPPPECARAISEASMLDDFEDDSVLRSIYAKLMGHEMGEMYSNSISTDVGYVQKGVSRPASGISFAGLDSFDEVRRGFEFSGDRSFYPPPSRANRRGTHRRDESAFSMASISSYGRVLNNGASDPFDYGLPSLRERPSSEDISSISMSMTVEDTFAFIHDQPRRRVDSDASSFYFRPVGTRGHGRRESNISIASQGPPISLYNRSFGNHLRNDSSASLSSIAMSYAKHGANSGLSAWARHRKDPSIDSVMSDFSAMHLGRPGIGDKMFDHAVDLGFPLTSISASPLDRLEVSESGYNQPSYDSILDDEPRSSVEDSLFEKTGQHSSVSSDYVFGDDMSHSYEDGLLPPHQFRPLSVLSLNTTHGPIHEDDTMISMLGGGGHVRRRSLISLMEGSPCVRIEKRKHSAIQEPKAFKNVERHESPNKARIVEKPSIASASSFRFGEERMIKVMDHQSLEDSCFVADGEDVSGFCMPVFTRPLPARSRSSTCTSSSGADTPPLSSSDGSSMSDGSQSSIDLTQLSIAIANVTHPLPSTGRTRLRARARGNGHRRRYSRSHVSRSSVYETIEEEVGPSPTRSIASRKDDPTTRQTILIVDPDTMSVHSKGEETVWDDERGIVALRKFYALRDEAENTVTESKRIWIDTPFSIFALQSFQPPLHPAGMRALLEHSVQSYGPLPSDLRPRRIRSRTSSRPSPYPPTRVSKPSVTNTSSKDQNQIANDASKSIAKSIATPVLRDLPVSSNVSTAPTLDTLKPFSPFVIDSAKTEKPTKDDKNVDKRPRVGSTARRTALGWSKRSTGKSGQKENAGVGKENLVGTGTTTTPGNTLRLNRPRPKGRTPGGKAPASQNRPIRV